MNHEHELYSLAGGAWVALILYMVKYDAALSFALLAGTGAAVWIWRRMAK